MNIDFWVQVVAILFALCLLGLEGLRWLRDSLWGLYPVRLVYYFLNPSAADAALGLVEDDDEIEYVPAPSARRPASPTRSYAAPVVDYAGAYATYARGGGMDEWMKRVNDDPDYNPHLAVVGPSRSGKTSLVVALLHTRPGRFVVCTPKSAATDPWAGFPAVRLAYANGQASWENIGHAISAVHREMIRRNASNQRYDGDEITLVIDELSTTVASIPGILRRVLELWAMGASARVRVVAIDTSINVRAWGIDGRGDIRDSMLIIRTDFYESTSTRSAEMFRFGKEPRWIDTADVYDLSHEPLDPARLWLPPTTDTPASEMELTDRAGVVRTRAERIAELSEQVADVLESQDITSINDVCRALGRATHGEDWQDVRAALDRLSQDGHEEALLLLQRRARRRSARSSRSNASE